MDFTSLYSTRIQSTFDEDQSEILRSFLKTLASKEGSKVSLTNYYKGLPLIYPATILGVERGNLDLDVNPQQAVAISDDRYTLIRSKIFNYPIVAHVQYVNIKKHIVSLNKLCYVEVLAEKRAAVRLNLEPPVMATLLYEEEKVDGEVVDISTQGLAIAVDRYIELEAGTDVSVRFLLPDPVMMKQTLIKVPATIVEIAGDSSPYRCKLKMFPEKHVEQLISRYSFQRQVEIIKGLKEMAE